MTLCDACARHTSICLSHLVKIYQTDTWGFLDDHRQSEVFLYVYWSPSVGCVLIRILITVSRRCSYTYIDHRQSDVFLYVYWSPSVGGVLIRILITVSRRCSYTYIDHRQSAVFLYVYSREKEVILWVGQENMYY